MVSFKYAGQAHFIEDKEIIEHKKDTVYRVLRYRLSCFAGTTYYAITNTIYDSFFHALHETWLRHKKPENH